MKRRFFSLALGMMLSLLAGQTWAQNSQDAQAEAAVLESRRQQIHELVMIRLNNALDLSPTQSAQLSQVLTKHRKEKVEYRNKIRQLTLQLREVSVGGKEAQIQSLIQQIAASQAKLDQVDERMYAEAKKPLNIQQQAQFIFVMDEIRREVQAIKRGSPPPGGGAINVIQGGAGKVSGPGY